MFLFELCVCGLNMWNKVLEENIVIELFLYINIFLFLVFVKYKFSVVVSERKELLFL